MKLWGKSVTDSCKLCGNRDSTLHLLAGCPVMLEQQRYMCRHNSVITYLQSLFKNCHHTITTDRIYGDGVTINPCLTTTSLILDLVVETDNEVIITELTVAFETNIAARHKYKEDKYAHFLSDITRKKCSLICWEIGARGLFTDENVARLRKIHSLTDCLRL